MAGETIGARSAFAEVITSAAVANAAFSAESSSLVTVQG